MFYVIFFQVKGDLSGIPVMLVGNKSDDNDKREVNTSTGEALQVKKNMQKLYCGKKKFISKLIV